MGHSTRLPQVFSAQHIDVHQFSIFTESSNHVNIRVHRYDSLASAYVGIDFCQYRCHTCFVLSKSKGEGQALSNPTITADSCEPSLVRPAMDRQEAEAVAEMLRAIADPARLQVLSILKDAPSLEACVCDLVNILQLSQPTVSHHLKVLLHAGLVTRERRGSWAFYKLAPENLGALRNLIS